MDSSPILRKHSQHKIHNDFQRMKNEHNKMLADPKPSKLHSSHHLSDQDSENKDPGKAEMARKPPVRPGVSRLPVLAKSLELQTPSDFSQSHCRWEEKPLTGKAKKKKPCTRPVPFNFSQPRSIRATSENQQSQTGHTENNVCKARLKTQNINTKLSKYPAGLNSTTKETMKSYEKATENTVYLLGQSGPLSTFKTSSTSYNSQPSLPIKAKHQNSASSTQPALSAETCVTNMNLLSLKDPTKIAHANPNFQLSTQENFSKGSTAKGENFQPDHAALLSILRTEGVSGTGLGSATPQSKPYNYQPQRVSVMKSQQKAGSTTGPVRSVRFSPDAAALQSILLNEGVKAQESVGVTPRNSTCPSGRGTSVYTAQRVLVKKTRAEPASGTVAIALNKETPLKQWTPQRVRNTRHRPMSAAKWHVSTQQLPYAGTPGVRSCKTNFQPSQEKIVQRLFDDQEDEQSLNVTDKDPETETEQIPLQASTDTAPCEENLQTGRADTSEDEDEEQKQRTMVGQPFFPAPQRESVIVFSTSKKLFRATHFEKQESSSHQDQHGPVSSEQRKVLPVHGEMSSVADPACQIKPCIPSLHKDLIVQRSCTLSPAVAFLRKRFPPLEELRMDEEVATYTSVCVQTTPGFMPSRPCCGNPLAAILHFEESTRFVPIGFDLPSGSSSPGSSTLQK
ncbi:uncharacterized protein troap [Mastacembelus armatus]|uniref:Trophinin associated protein n=1 Tax=Mastacembelus armatus TaxID=205130 RepID=A0A3Q3LT10_9TELE|nr:uncharacterized protein LOC113145051 [Mastacembelus armatus]